MLITITILIWADNQNLAKEADVENRLI